MRRRQSRLGDAATDAPLVVLVNGTAGAAEVLAAALHDTPRHAAGTATMGKGSVQVTKPLLAALALYGRPPCQPSGYLIDNVARPPTSR
ncbi:MAG: S41 family peptidase [Eggerthellaceae bacterium]